VQVFLENIVDDITLLDSSKLNMSTRLQTSAGVIIDVDNIRFKGVNEYLEGNLTDYVLQTKVVTEKSIDLEGTMMDLEFELEKYYIEVLGNGARPYYSAACKLDK
jgi:hypothetical protein